jgi:hypothetical protein
MPYFAGGTDNTGMEGFGTLAQALFPDPSKLGQAQYYGAEARRAQQQTSDMVATAQAKQRLGAAIQGYTAHQSPENLAAIISAGTQAGITDPRQILSGLVAGATGSGSMPQSVADAMLPGLGVSYGSTKTGTQAAEAAQTQRQAIASGPNYQQAALERQKYGDTRLAFAGPGGDTVYLPPGQNPPAGYRPLATVAEAERQQIASAPQARQAELAGQKQAGESRPYVVPGSGKYGAVIVNVPVTQQPPPGAVPYDPANPQQAILGTGAFGQAGPGGVAGTIAGTDGPTVSPPGTNGPTAQPAATPPSPTVSPAGTNGPTGGLAGVIVPQDQPNIFDQAASGALPKPGAQTPGAGLQLDRLIDNRLAQFNKENLGVGGLGLNKEFILGDDARSALQARVAQLVADRSNRSTFENAPGALNQAWTELAPRFQQDTHYLKPGSSVLTLGPPSPGAGAGKSTPAPKPAAAQPAAPQPPPANAAPPPAPPDPKARQAGQVYQTLSGPMLWTGQGWQRLPAQAAQAGP